MFNYKLPFLSLDFLFAFFTIEISKKFDKIYFHGQIKNYFIFNFFILKEKIFSNLYNTFYRQIYKSINC